MLRVRVSREQQMYYLARSGTGAHRVGYVHFSEGPLCHVDVQLLAMKGRFNLESNVCLRESHVDMKGVSAFLPSLAVSDVTTYGVRVRYGGQLLQVRRERHGYLLSLKAGVLQEAGFVECVRAYSHVLRHLLLMHTDSQYREWLALGPPLRKVAEPAWGCVHNKNLQKVKPPEHTEFEERLLFPSVTVRLEDVVGCEEVKSALLRVHRDITSPRIARYFGRDPAQQSGILLYGSHGCGKTLLVSALVNLLRTNLGGRFKAYKIDYDRITSIWRGGEAKRMARVFDLVEANAGANIHTLLFLDELHAIARRHRYDEALDTLLSKVGGASDRQNITLIGATSMAPNELDDALLRPGRFGEHYAVGFPDDVARATLFGQLLKKASEIACKEKNPSFLGDISFDRLVNASSGMTCAQIVGCVRDALIYSEKVSLQRAGGVCSREALAVHEPLNTDSLLKFIRARSGASIGFRQGILGAGGHKGL